MKPLGIIKKYYPESSNVYRILVTHSRSVADRALASARLHPEMNLDPIFIEEATMLHDIGIFLCNAPDTDCHRKADYICYGYLGADLTRGEGHSRHVLICEGHAGAGLPLAMIEERNLPVSRRDMCPASLEGQLIYSVDKFFSRTKLTKERPADEIKQNLSKYGSEAVERPEHWYKFFLGE